MISSRLSAEEIRDWRLAHGASQRQCAQVLGASERSWWTWEHGGWRPFWLPAAMDGASKKLRRLVAKERNQQRANLRRQRKREQNRRVHEQRAQARFEARQQERARKARMRATFAEAERVIRSGHCIPADVERVRIMRQALQEVVRGA